MHGNVRRSWPTRTHPSRALPRSRPNARRDLSARSASGGWRTGSQRLRGLMPAQPTEWTIEMVRALPDDGNRYEVMDGELFVTPAPSLVHQRAVVELLDIVRPYVKTHGVGEALVSPADVVVYG